MRPSTALLIVSLFTPLSAFAACEFTHAPDTMTIVVGKKNKCYSSESFSDMFKAELSATLKTRGGKEAPSIEQKAPAGEGSSSVSNAWTLESGSVKR